jgi:hypothetical protein
LRFGQNVGEAPPRDILHGVIVHAPFAADGEDRHDVRMVEPGDRLGLAAKAVHGVFVDDGPEPQHFQGDVTVKRGLLGLVNHTHAATAKLANDPKLAQSRWRFGRRTGRSLNELDAGQPRIELRGQLRVSLAEPSAIGSAAPLEIGHVAVQDARQISGRVGRRHQTLVGRAAGARLVERRFRFAHRGPFPYTRRWMPGDVDEPPPS